VGVGIYAALVAETGGVAGGRVRVFGAETERIMASLCGQQLDAVTVYQYWFEGSPGGEVAGFWLHFSDRPTYYVNGYGSEALQVTRGEPGSTEDMDAYGQMRVHPAVAGHPLAGLVGHRLLGAEPVCSQIQGCRTGLLLRFDHASIIVLMYCDDLWFIPGDTPPAMMFEQLTVGTWTARP